MHFDAPPVRALGDAAGVASAESWLADEVAVDFPSLAPIVDRMRSTLLGDHAAGDALSAELRLTPRQACTGGRVPVDVPVRRLCRPCGGRGEVWSDACQACGGHGAGLSRRTVEVHVPAGVRAGACLVFSVGHPHEPPTRVHLHVVIG